MDLLRNNHLMFCIFGITIGILTVIGSYIGWRSLKSKSPQLLWIYNGYIVILMVLQIALIIHYNSIAFVAAETSEMQHHFENPNMETMSQIEIEFQCCGLNDSADYSNANKSIPDSCSRNGNIYPNGCLWELQKIAKMKGTEFQISNWMLLSMHTVTVIASTCLALSLHTNSRAVLG